MADTNIRDTKIVQYLNEALGKEKELETSLEAHVAMTTRAPYKKRLQEHLRETKGHSRALEKRIKQLGGSDAVGDVTSTAQSVLARAAATAKGPLHMVRGTGEQEKMLKNAKTEYWNEHEEIATYTAIETLAEAVGDKDTAKLARGIRREEERMARFLEKQIPQLTKAVVQEEVPASERRKSPRRRSSAKRSSSSRSSSAGKSSTSRRGSSSKAGAASKRSKSSGRSSSSKASAASKRSSSAKRSGSSKSGSASSKRSRGGGAKKRGS